MTEAQYKEELARIEKINPGEVLLPLLRKGYSSANVIYMRFALKRLPQPKKAEKRDTRSVSDVVVEPENSADPVLRQLWAQKGKLFRERAKLSNQFHDCTTDAQRKQVSAAILKIWAQIRDIESRMTFYEQTGQLPESSERFPLPDNPAEIIRKLNSLRSNVCFRKDQLRKLAAMPDSPELQRKIAAVQEKLKELQLYVAHAEKAAKEVVHA